MRISLLAVLVSACFSSSSAFFAPGSAALALSSLRTSRAASTADSTLRGGCAATEMSVTVPTLFDLPVSNNGARCRIIIYKKGLTEADVVSSISSCLSHF